MSLTTAQIKTLSLMAIGYKMIFSSDGDLAWINSDPPHRFLTNEQTIGLRKLGYIQDVYERQRDKSLSDWHGEITSAGRIALEKSADRINPREDVT